MFITHFFALAMLSLSASAEMLNCNPNGDFFTLAIDGEQVVYDGVEATFSFDREGLAVTTYPVSKIVTFALGETAIIFRATAHTNPEKNSVKGEIVVGTTASGVGILNDGHLSDCSVSLSEIQSPKHKDVPKELKKKILDKVSFCLRHELCPVLGAVHSGDIKY